MRRCDVYHIALYNRKCKSDRLRDVILHQEASYRDGWPNEPGKDLPPSENGLAGIKAMDSGRLFKRGPKQSDLVCSLLQALRRREGRNEKDTISKQECDVLRLHCQ